jgi:hypothetical protein
MAVSAEQANFRSRRRRRPVARIKTIKPEFWTSEQVVECSTNARLLFIGLWNFCDDSGIHPASASRLKMEVFPSEAFSTDHIASLVDELIREKLLEVYEVSGKSYWRVTGWLHQKIDKPSYKYPLPDGSIPVAPLYTSGRRKVAEHSTNGSRRLVDGPPADVEVDVEVEVDKEGKGCKGESLIVEIWKTYPQTNTE